MPVPLHQAQAELCRMLGRPVRPRVPELLQGGPMPVRALLTTIEGDPPTLSQHPGVLRRSGPLTSARRGSAAAYGPPGADVAELTRAARRTLTGKLSEQDQLPVELREAEGAAS